MTEYVPRYEGSDVSAVRFALRSGARALMDRRKWSRFRWTGTLWVTAVGTVILGSGFTIAGGKIVDAAGIWAMYARVPGGLHLHGVLMLAIGVPMLACLGVSAAGYPEPKRALHRLCRAAAYYYLWSAVLLAMADLLPDGEFSFVGVVTWSMIALWLGLLSVSDPPLRVSKVEMDVLRAALDVGVSPVQAHALAVRMTGGSGDDIN